MIFTSGSTMRNHNRVSQLAIVAAGCSAISNSSTSTFDTQVAHWFSLPPMPSVPNWPMSVLSVVHQSNNGPSMSNHMLVAFAAAGPTLADGNNRLNNAVNQFSHAFALAVVGI